MRIKLTYAAEAQDRVPAFLLIPHEARQPLPAMLCLHPTHIELGKAQICGLAGQPSRFYAHELAEAGFVCLAPDYPSFGEYKYDFHAEAHNYASGTMKSIWNNIRALDVLETLPCVNRDKIGAIGHSLGGHNALFTAAFDQRIRCVVSSCGFNSFADYYGGDLKGWSKELYMPRIKTQFELNHQKMPFDFPEVLAAIAPRPIFVNAPLHDANFAVEGVRKCEAALKPLLDILQKPEMATFVYPDAAHDFPSDIRQQAYKWLHDHL
jgi:dienelactone hydrolase